MAKKRSQKSSPPVSSPKQGSPTRYGTTSFIFAVVNFFLLIIVFVTTALLPEEDSPYDFVLWIFVLLLFIGIVVSIILAIVSLMHKEPSRVWGIIGGILSLLFGLLFVFILFIGIIAVLAGY